FAIAAFGVTEATSLGGSSTTITETKREPGFTSKWGLEQASGHHWTWGSDSSYRYDANSEYSWKNETAGRGQLYTQGIYGLTYVLLGGTRTNDASAGSRASNWFHFPWNTGWHIGLRAACDHLVL